MSKHLYLTESRARYNYICSGCGVVIARGLTYFRHDPYPSARMYRGEKATQWCFPCISSASVTRDGITGRIRVPMIQVSQDARADTKSNARLALARVELVGVGRAVADYLSSNPSLIYGLSPSQFEEFICDRLDAMGFEPKRVSDTFHKDGGIDVIFWPRISTGFPVLGAAQVKHHRSPSTKEGVEAVRDLSGVLGGFPFNIGFLVTNTSFTPDAEWFARERAKLLRLRDFADIKRWLSNNFSDQEEWREFPETIEVCPGVVVPVRPRSTSSDGLI